MEKGISPLIAVVMLIAFVVAVAGILMNWLSGFATQETELVQEKSETSITCSYGSVSAKSAEYSDPRLSATVENTGQISIGNVTLSVVYQNATSQQVELCGSAGGAVSCSNSNLSLGVGEQESFNVTIWGSNYDSVKVITNCTGVGDELERGDIA